MVSLMRKGCWILKGSFPVGTLREHASSRKEYRLLSSAVGRMQVKPVQEPPDFGEGKPCKEDSKILLQTLPRGYYGFPLLVPNQRVMVH